MLERGKYYFSPCFVNVTQACEVLKNEEKEGVISQEAYCTVEKQYRQANVFFWLKRGQLIVT